MLRKRSRPVPNQNKGHLLPDSTSDPFFSSDSVAPKARNTSFFSVPGIFVGLCSKGISDSESAWSPTSHLECRAFSNLGNSFTRSPGSPGLEGQSRRWDCCRVGLGLVDSLSDESKNILIGSQMRINNPIPKTHLDCLKNDPLGAAPKSLPKDYGNSSRTRIGSPNFLSGCSKAGIGSNNAELELGEFGKIHSCSADTSISSAPLSRFVYNNLESNSEFFPSNSKNPQSESPPLDRGGKNSVNFPGSLPISVTPSDDFVGSLSASEIELSEDYTCIITHGPNPKTTHIFGNCILESHTILSPDCKIKIGGGGGSPCHDKCSGDSPHLSSDDFLSFCFSCKKKLEGNDIYIYRGEKAFCSCNCRDQEILTEEGLEKPTTDLFDSVCSSFNEEIFLAGVMVAT